MLPGVRLVVFALASTCLAAGLARAGTGVRFTTNQGTFDVELFDATMPDTVANFLTYVSSGRYASTIFHRSTTYDPFNIQIIQGGGFRLAGNTLQPVVTNPPIRLEPSTANLRGTIAMARTSDPNSATSGWYFNVTNNPGLDFNYAVFGTVTGTGLAVIDRIGAVQVYDASPQLGPTYSELPLLGPALTITNLVVVNNVSVVSPWQLTIAVPSGTQTQAQAGYQKITTAASLTKTGSGAIALTADNTFSGPTTVSQGTLRLATAGALSASAVTVAPGARLSVGPQVAAAVPALANNGLVDVGRGGLTITAGQTAAGIVAAIVAGRNDGTWDGLTGITSGAAATQSERAVGWLDNGDGSFTVGYAAAGDWNVNGIVDFDDVVQCVSAGLFDTGLPATWSQGDYDYNGVVDFDDVLAQSAAGLFDTGPYNLAPGGMAALGLDVAMPVPEPSTWALVLAGLACAGFALTRRHPAALPPADLLGACSETRTKRSGPGGQHRNKTETAVVLLHGPTGITAEASERRSQAENRAVALKRLRLKLAVEHRTPIAPAGPSALWRSRVRGRQVIVSAGHGDFPSLVAEALDHLHAAGFEIPCAAERLGVTGTQLVRLLRKSPAAWAALNASRASLGLPGLKG